MLQADYAFLFSNAPRLPDLVPQLGRKYFMIVGPAGSGKDSAAVLLSKMFNDVEYGGSTSLVMLPFVRVAFEYVHGKQEMTNQQFYDMRAEHRVFWYDTIQYFRNLDPLYAVKLALNRGNVLCGCRDIDEIKLALAKLPFEIFYMLPSKGSKGDPTWRYSPSTFSDEILNTGYSGPIKAFRADSANRLFLEFLNLEGLKLNPYGYSKPLSHYTLNGVDYGSVLRDRKLDLDLGGW